MTIVEFLTARIDEDEQVARAAIGELGREAGATEQHWQWTRSADDVEVTEDDIYPRRISPEPTYNTALNLGSVEHYQRTRWSLPDLVTTRVEEITVGGATHIARHDPARVLAEVAAKRAVLATYPLPEPQTDDELHRRIAHPAYEYEVFEYGRKTCEDRKTPEGDGWEMFDEERFDYTEVERWRRLRPDGPRPEYVPAVLRALATIYVDHPDYRQEWTQ